MKIITCLFLLFAAALAAPNLHVDYNKVVPKIPTVNVIEDAPQCPAGRIVNSNTASRGEFPYQAALYLDGSSFCGGSLISQRWVLTAAHCISSISSFTIYLGVENFDNIYSDSVAIETTPCESIVHYDFNPYNFQNDVAVVNLGKNIELSKYIQPIAIAAGSDLYVGNTARLSGWGKDSESTTSMSSTLKYADLTVITNSVCTSTYGVSSIVASSICTSGAGSNGACNGDAGSPLVDLNSGVQIGVMTFISNKGCSSGNPTGYSRVTSFSPWISAVTGI